MKYDGTNLKEVLEAHRRWLVESDGWTEDDRADLNGANLNGADLRSANLNGADLRNADLRNANLRSADLRSAKNIPFIPMTCPDTGEFTAWKQCWYKNGPNRSTCIVKLLIPADAERLSGTGRKCRASLAHVLEIQDLDGNNLPANTIAFSFNDYDFAYKVGATVAPEEPFCADRWQECSSGIHFFINRQEAVDY